MKIIWQTVRRITDEILGVKGLTSLYITYLYYVLKLATCDSLLLVHLITVQLMSILSCKLWLMIQSYGQGQAKWFQ